MRKGSKPKVMKKKKASVKAQIRGIERLLKRDLPDEVRAEQQARLQSLQRDAEGRKHARLEKRMCKKYHMVKFLDRTHISRRLKQVDRKLANDPPPPSKEEKEVLLGQRKQLLEDLEYVENFPRDR